MDCEKFKDTLLDELYGELDEVTSAAAKRHVGGCSRCASLLSGMKATRRLAVLPIVEPPADLEERILAAAREAQKVVPLKGKASRAVSWAGAWAMRPQNAMAALFLISVGLSAALIKGKHSAPPATMTVSEQGEPVASVIAGTVDRPADETLQTNGGGPFAVTPPPTAAASAASDSKSDALLDGLLARGRSLPASAPAGKLNMPAKPSYGEASGDGLPKALAYGDKDDGRNASNLSGGAPPQQHSVYAPGAGGGAARAAPPPPPAAAAPAPMPLSPAAATPQAQAYGPPTFASAKAAYEAGDYATATTLFDGLAQGGDLTSALWAARSVRRGVGGCPQAVGRFDQVARAGAGTATGYDATFDEGKCYQELGQLDAAKAQFASLITVPAYVDRAKNELARLGQKGATKPQAKAAAQAPAQQQQAAPPPQQQAPAATSTTQAY